MKKWQCSVCKHIHTEDAPPEKCPVCGVSGDKFVHLEEDSDTATPNVESAVDENKADAPPKESSAPNDSETPDASPLGKWDRAVVYLEKAADLMVKHHAHPMSVHLPNGVIPVVAILIILAWFSGSDMMLKAGFINLIFVLIGLPLVGLTGFLEWKKKYNQAQTTIFKIKISAAAVAAVCCIISMIWYLVNRRYWTPPVPGYLS